VFKWAAVGVLSLFALAIGVYAYAVLSFDAEALPENYGEVDAVLYAGEGRNQPLVVGFGGAEGGNTFAARRFGDVRARFIEQGYAFLAVGYFGGQSTPSELDRISLEGIHAAIVEAAEDPRVDADCIAVIGGSKGAELALLLASRYKEIKAVAAASPGSAVFPAHTIAMSTASFASNGEELPFVPVPWSAVPALIKGDLRAAFEAMLADEEAVERAAIPVERINGPILLSSATRDQFWPALKMSEAIVERLNRSDFRFPVQHVVTEGDHEASLQRWDVIEAFLAEHILGQNEAGCPR